VANSKHPFPYASIAAADADHWSKCGVPKHEATSYHLMLVVRGYYQVQEHKYQSLRKAYILDQVKNNEELQKRADAQMEKELGRVKA
jgi:hypothetical protein